MCDQIHHLWGPGRKGSRKAGRARVRAWWDRAKSGVHNIERQKEQGSRSGWEHRNFPSFNESHLSKDWVPLDTQPWRDLGCPGQHPKREEKSHILSWGKQCSIQHTTLSTQLPAEREGRFTAGISTELPGRGCQWTLCSDGHVLCLFSPHTGATSHKCLHDSLVDSQPQFLSLQK